MRKVLNVVLFIVFLSMMVSLVLLFFPYFRDIEWIKIYNTASSYLVLGYLIIEEVIKNRKEKSSLKKGMG